MHICSEQYFDLLFLPESLIYEICHQNAKNSHSRSGRIIGKVPQKLTKTGSNLMCPTKVPQNSYKIPIRDFIVAVKIRVSLAYECR